MSLTGRLSFGLHRNAALLFWAMFFSSAAYGTSERFKTLYIESLGATPALVGLLLGVGEAIRLIFLIASGPLSDRLSPRLLIGTRWLTAFNALFFLFATHWGMLIPAFIAQAGANLAWPSVSRVIDESGDAASRGRRFLLIYTIGPGAALLGAPLLGAVLVEEFGLRSVFVVLLVVLIISCYFFSSVQPAPLVKHATSAGYREVLRYRPTSALCLLSLASMFVAYLGLTLIPNFLHNERDISFGLIGAFGSLVAIGNIGAGMALTKGTWTSRSLNGSLLTMLFYPVAFILMLDSRHVALVGLAYLFIGIATVSQQAFYGPLGEVTPAHLRTRSFATFEVSNGLALTLAGFAAGILYAVAPSVPLWVALVGYTGVIAATVWLRRQLPLWSARAMAEAATV
ncbi:MAG: MFS transporter [Thermomicrobiales bacterium]|nr:MFS transporter [Thermomicrobiales bacterium]